MKDRAWFEARIAELKAGVDELQIKLYRNQGAIKALEEAVTDDSAPSPDVLRQAEPAS